MIPKVLVVIREEFGKLGTFVMATVPVNVAVVSENQSLDVVPVRFVENSNLEVVLRENLREAVFDLLSAHVESGSLAPKETEQLSLWLDKK